MHCGEPTWLSIFQSVLLLFADSTMIPKFSYSSGQKMIEFRHSDRPWYTKFCSWVLEASSNHSWRGGLVYWESAKECMKYRNARGESWAAWWSRMQARCLKTWAWVLGTWISSKCLSLLCCVNSWMILSVLQLPAQVHSCSYLMVTRFTIRWT